LRSRNLDWPTKRRHPHAGPFRNREGRGAILDVSSIQQYSSSDLFQYIAGSGLSLGFEKAFCMEASIGRLRLMFFGGIGFVNHLS